MSKHRVATRDRALRFRLYPDETQRDALLLQGHGTRALWNLLHAWWLMARRDRKATLKRADAQIRLARKEIPWITLVPAQAAQQVLKTYYRAWQGCWAGNSGAPRFKARTGWLGIDLPQARDLNIVRESDRFSSVQVPLIGRVRFRHHRAIVGTVTGARLICEPDGKWFLSLRVTQTVRAANPVKKATQPTVGIDRGVAVPLALSDGRVFRHRDWLKSKERERLHRLEVKGARQRAGRRARGGRIGANERDTYNRIAALHCRARRRRTDWLHYASRRVAQGYSITGVEDLNVQNMTRSPARTPDPDLPGQFLPNGAAAKSGLNRVILAESWSTFHTFLTYKQEDRAGQVITVPAPYTSLKCHQCRTVTVGSRENQATFVCKHPACGWAGNADYNASCNVEIGALEKHASRICEPVTVHSSALGTGLVLVPAGGTPVAARPADNDAGVHPGSTTAGCEAEPHKGEEAGTKHGEPCEGSAA